MNISDILAAEARVVASLDLEIPVAKPPIEPVIGFPTGRTTNPLHIGIGAIVLVGFAIFAAMLVGREVDRAGWTSDTREVPAGSAPSSEISEVLIPSGIAIDQATPKNSAAETETKEPPSAKSAPLPQPAAPVREEKLRTIPEPSPPIRDVQPPAVEAWSPRTSSSSAVEMERERINAGDVAVSLSLQIKSFVETGTLTLYIDGDSVFATDLRREAAGRLHRLKKVVHRGEQSIDQTLDVASGVHEFRVVMYNEAKDRTLDRTITAELEPGVGRTLQITAGRTFGKRLSLSLH